MSRTITDICTELANIAELIETISKDDDAHQGELDYIASRIDSVGNDVAHLEKR